MNAPSVCWRSRITALLLTAALPLGLVALAEEASDDPLPLRRVVLLTQEQQAAELEHVKEGILLQLPRAEFEKHLRDAAAKVGGAKNTPRLIEARYRATLQKGSALVGTGQWKAINPAAGPALLPLQPLNLALRQARFENAGKAKPEALLAEFDGRSPALLLEQPGEASVALDWSARADIRPDGLYFTLEFPPAPIALLELNLPADYVVNVGAGVALSGPHPAEAENRRFWKISCSGKPDVTLWLRRAAEIASAPPLVFVRQQTTQILTPEGMEATYQFDLEAPRPGVRVLQFECDPELRPCEANGPNVESLQVMPAAPGKPTRLLVRLREPLPSGSETVTIRCLAPLGNPLKSLRPPPAAESRLALRDQHLVAWTSPGMRLVQVVTRENAPEQTGRAVQRGETLEVLAHPDVRLDDWHVGAFRLLETATKLDSEGKTPLQSLTLLGGGIEPEGATERRPSARLQAGGVEFRARQATLWELTADYPSLTLQIAYEVSHGQLFQLPVQLPAGWDITSVAMTPASLSPAAGGEKLLRTWGVWQDYPEKGKSTLLVELQRPLTANDTRREPSVPVPLRPRGPVLTVQLHPLRPAPIAGHVMPFPEAVPLGARFREGSLGIKFDEQLYVPVLKPSLPESEPDEEGPWGKQTPDVYFSYRNQALTGTLLLRSRAPQVRAKCSSEFSLAPGRAAVEVHLLIEGETGSVQTLDVAVSAASQEPWEWRVEQGDNQVRRSVERRTMPEARDLAAVVAVQQPLAMAALAGARSRGEHWRITFAHPLKLRAPLLLRATRKLDASADHWEVPLLTVLNASRMEGEATLHLAGGERVQIETFGLREAPASTGSARGRASPWRTFRYGELPVGLTLRGQNRGGERAAAVLEDARLTTYVALDGSLQAHFQFQALHWPGRTLAVTLPAGAQLLAVQVDGRWLSQLTLTEGDAGKNLLHLPVPARDGQRAREPAHLFEIVYTLPARGTFLWQLLASPPPELPAPPLQFRQTWRLPPGVRPLDEVTFRRLPGPGEGYDADDWRRRLEAKLPAVVTQSWREKADDTAAQMQALADACQALRKGQEGKTLSLSEVIELVQSQTGKEIRGLVLDVTALEEAGIGPDQKVKIQPLASSEDQTPPWEALGLMAVSARAAPLLTTRRQWEVWPARAGDNLEVPEAVDAAVSEAAANGHDSSGRFRLALEWSSRSADGESAGPTHLLPGLLSPAPALLNWTEWETLPGTDPAAAARFIRGETVAAVGLLLAALLGLTFGWLRQRSVSLRLAYLLLWLATAGVALAWLPAALRALALWPLVLAGVLALGWYLVVLIRRAPRKAPATVIATAATAAGLLLALLERPEPGQALPPAPQTVYIIPGPPEQPDRQTVLVTPELLEYVQGLSRPTVLSPSGAVLLSASYDGKIVDGVAEFSAVYQAFCLNPDAAALTIPLDGVRLLDEVWLDGGRAFPTALSPPQVGYALKLPGPGAHKIEMRFRAAVASTGEDQDLQFTAPRLLQSRLRLELPASASFVQAVSRYGAETLTSAAAGRTLEVDLGRLTGPVHLHWFQETLPPPATKVRYQEAYCWDLRTDAPSLTGLIHFNVIQGNTVTLDVRLPPELEVRGVEARRFSTGGAIRLQSWRVRIGAGEERSLRLRFQSPVRGEILIGLDLVPAVPLASTTTLPLPTPQGSPSGDSYLAYRVLGLDVQRPSAQRLRVIKKEEFAPFWPDASRPSSASLAYCAAFKRESGQGPVLRVQMRQHAPPVQALQDVRFLLDGRMARLRASIQLTTPRNDLSLAEWELQSPQGVTISSISGDDVRNWSQSGNRLLVWLDKTRNETKLQMTGWLPLAQPKDGPRFDLPCLRLLGAQTQQTTVHVVARGGLAVRPAELRNLLSLSEQQGAETEWAFTSKQPSYGGSFSVHQAAASADVRTLTFLEVEKRQVKFTTTIQLKSDLRTVQVHLRDWPGEDVKVEGGRVLQQRRKALDERTWTVELRPASREPFPAALPWVMGGLAVGLNARPKPPDSATHSYRVTLSGALPIDEAVGGVSAPQVTVGNAASLERWLAVAGPDLGVESVFGLTMPPLAKWPDELKHWRRNGGQVWQATASDGTLRLVPRDHNTDATPVHVLFREHTLAVADNQHWLHEAVYWLRHEAHTDLNLTLPAAARVVAVSLDGVETPPLQPEPARLWLPLPGRPGVCCVRLLWLYDSPEPLDRPNLEPPKLDGAEEGTCLWTVHVPPSFEVAAMASDLKPGLGRAAWADLQRAEALVQITRQLLEASSSNGSSPAVKAAQQRFAELSRQVERTLAAAGGAPGETGPDGVALSDWLQQLRAQNHELAQQFRFEEAEEEGEKGRKGDREKGGWNLPFSPSPVLPTNGMPLYGWTEANAPGPALQLTSETVRRHRTAWLTSMGWLAGVVLMGGFAFFPVGRFVSESVTIFRRVGGTLGRRLFPRSFFPRRDPDSRNGPIPPGPIPP
jgi:hypothetical protein